MDRYDNFVVFGGGNRNFYRRFAIKCKRVNYNYTSDNGIYYQNLNTLKTPRAIGEHTEMIVSIAISKSGSFIVTGGLDGQIMK